MSTVPTNRHGWDGEAGCGDSGATTILKIRHCGRWCRDCKTPGDTVPAQLTQTPGMNESTH